VACARAFDQRETHDWKRTALSLVFEIVIAFSNLSVLSPWIEGLHSTLETIPVRFYVDTSFTFFLFSLTLTLPVTQHEPTRACGSYSQRSVGVGAREPLRFRRRTPSNPSDFNEFLQALRSSETIRTATCGSHQEVGIAEDEWVLLVKTLGSINDIHHLTLYCTHGSRDFHPFQALADAVNSAHSLHQLRVDLQGETVPRDPSGMIALANALREHTALQEFSFYDWSPLLGTAQSTALDPSLRALQACPHLQKVVIKTKCISADAVKNLLQLRLATNFHLIVNTEHITLVGGGRRDSTRSLQCSNAVS
jgi:hypothetical protein